MIAMRCRIIVFLCLAVMLQVAVAAPSVRAFLDRSHVSLGDTVTLNIQSDGPLADPDLSPLQQDFEVLGTSRSRSVEVVNGRTTSTSQLGIALRPLHTGTLVIPALAVGHAHTHPLTVEVTAAPSGGHGKAGDPAFMEAGVLSSSPYVGQQTVYTVRLFYLPGVQGSLGDPDADGARLLQLDADHRYTVQRDGYTYNVLERSWALVPQQPGTITVTGPRFRGQDLSAGLSNVPFNNPNALLNGPFAHFGAGVEAAAPALAIKARAAPARAGKPWLPARKVQLQLEGWPAGGHAEAGVPLTITLRVNAEGVPADELPEPQLPSIAGARVYPDQTRDKTDTSGQWLEASRTRSFAIVPGQAGKLEIPAITLGWWDVVHDRAAQAMLPVHVLEVTGTGAPPASGSAPAVGGPMAPSAQQAPLPSAAVAADAAKQSAVDAKGAGRWRALALASLALWLLVCIAIAWWFWRARRRERPAATSATRAAQAAGAEAAGQAARDPATRRDPSTLQHAALAAAAGGDAAACERAMLAWARAVRPGVVNVADLRAALADPAQRDALEALEHARWGGGHAAAAGAAVAAAFAHGFAWRSEGRPRPDSGDDGLPPLYPPG